MELREYSIPEVREFAHRLKDVNWEPGLDATLSTLSSDVQQYIINELLLCQYDWKYFSDRYAMTVDDRGVTVPIRLWPSQQLVYDLISKEEKRVFDSWKRGEGGVEMQAKLWIIIAKARQLGLTVLGENLMSHLTLLHNNTRSIIASDDIRTNSPKLYRVFTNIYDNLPKWMQPPVTTNIKNTNMHFGIINSDLVVGGGNQKNTLGQGMTIDAIHLTEVSTWRDDVARAINEDLKPAFLSSRKHHSLFIMESTGKGGKGNFFYDQWDAACRGLGSFKPIFIGWHSCPDKYFLHDAGMVLGEDVLQLAKRLEGELAVRLTREQLCWYQQQKREAEAMGDLQIFLQEYPSTAEEAFQFGVRSVFPIEVRSRVRNGCETPVGVFDINWEVPQPKGMLRALDVEEWAALPDKDGEVGKEENKLLVWEYARPGYTYVIGVDVSYGHDGMDNSCVQVIRVGNRWSKDKQVAEWNGNVAPTMVDKVVWILGDVIYRDRLDDFPAKVAVECHEGSPGVVVQSKLEDKGYQNFYVQRMPATIGGGLTRRLGWHTNTATRDPLIHRGIAALKQGELEVKSSFVVKEMDTFVVKMTEQGKRKIEHADKFHDDRLLALFIAYYVAHEGEMSMIAEERALMLMRMQEPKETKVRQYIAMPEMRADGINERWEEEMEKLNGYY